MPKPKRERFPKRVVVATGWPDVSCGPNADDITLVGMRPAPDEQDMEELRIPKAIFDDDAPAYRLVLERVDAKKGKMKAKKKTRKPWVHAPERPTLTTTPWEGHPPGMALCQACGNWYPVPKGQESGTVYHQCPSCMSGVRNDGGAMPK